MGSYVDTHTNFSTLHFQTATTLLQIVAIHTNNRDELILLIEIPTSFHPKTRKDSYSISNHDSHYLWNGESLSSLESPFFQRTSKANPQWTHAKVLHHQTSSNETDKMVGRSTYSHEQIQYILDLKSQGHSNDEIARTFRAEFKNRAQLDKFHGANTVGYICSTYKNYPEFRTKAQMTPTGAQTMGSPAVDPQSLRNNGALSSSPPNHPTSFQNMSPQMIQQMRDTHLLQMQQQQMMGSRGPSPQIPQGANRAMAGIQRMDPSMMRQMQQMQQQQMMGNRNPSPQIPQGANGAILGMQGMDPAMMQRMQNMNQMQQRNLQGMNPEMIHYMQQRGVQGMNPEMIHHIQRSRQPQMQPGMEVGVSMGGNYQTGGGSNLQNNPEGLGINMTGMASIRSMGPASVEHVKQSQQTQNQQGLNLQRPQGPVFVQGMKAPISQMEQIQHSQMLLRHQAEIQRSRQAQGPMEHLHHGQMMQNMGATPTASGGGHIGTPAQSTPVALPEQHVFPDKKLHLKHLIAKCLQDHPSAPRDSIPDLVVTYFEAAGLLKNETRVSQHSSKIQNSTPPPTARKSSASRQNSEIRGENSTPDLTVASSSAESTTSEAPITPRAALSPPHDLKSERKRYAEELAAEPAPKRVHREPSTPPSPSPAPKQLPEAVTKRKAPMEPAEEPTAKRVHCETSASPSPAPQAVAVALPEDTENPKPDTSLPPLPAPQAATSAPSQISTKPEINASMRLPPAPQAATVASSRTANEPQAQSVPEDESPEERVSPTFPVPCITLDEYTSWIYANQFAKYQDYLQNTPFDLPSNMDWT
jgi:hypothetical protein